MTRSKPTITLIDYRLSGPPNFAGRKPGQCFKVSTLTGSTNYPIGQMLAQRQVDEIIQSGWNVNLRGPKKGEL